MCFDVSRQAAASCREEAAEGRGRKPKEASCRAAGSPSNITAGVLSGEACSDNLLDTSRLQDWKR